MVAHGTSVTGHPAFASVGHELVATVEEAADEVLAAAPPPPQSGRRTRCRTRPSPARARQHLLNPKPSRDAKTSRTASRSHGQCPSSSRRLRAVRRPPGGTAAMPGALPGEGQSLVVTHDGQIVTYRPHPGPPGAPTRVGGAWVRAPRLVYRVDVPGPRIRVAVGRADNFLAYMGFTRPVDDQARISL